MSELTVKDTEARKRLLSLFDEGTFTELDAFAKSADGEIEVVAGYGSVNGVYAYAFSQDITVDGGAISVAQCAKIKDLRACQENRLPCYWYLRFKWHEAQGRL